MHASIGYLKRSLTIVLVLLIACFFLPHQNVLGSGFSSDGSFAPGESDPITYRGINPGDTLDVLFLRREDLLKLPKKGIAFSFVTEKNNKPTMHGWVKNKSNDKPDPAIKLGYGCVGEAVYQADTKLGDMVLTKKQVKNLQKQLEKAGTEYLIFKPVIENKNVKYEVLVTSELPSDKSRLGRAVTTGEYVSPS